MKWFGISKSRAGVEDRWIFPETALLFGKFGGTISAFELGGGEDAGEWLSGKDGRIYEFASWGPAFYWMKGNPDAKYRFRYSLDAVDVGSK